MSIETPPDGISCAAIMARFFDQPGFLLARIDQIITVLYGTGAAGETLAQAEFLLLLGHYGQAPQIALARATGVDKSTTAYILDNLEARGWIARSPDPQDRRRARVQLTDMARAMIPAIEAAYAALQVELVSPLATDDAILLRDMLHKISANPLSPAPLWAAMEAGGDARPWRIEEAPSFLCRRAMQIFQAQFGTSNSSVALTSRQFSLLVILSQRADLSQATFARMFGLDPSTCGVIMRNLARRGLIVRRPSPDDGREHVFSITKEGAALLAGVQPLVDSGTRTIFRGESTQRIRWLVRQLQCVVMAYSQRLRFPGEYGSD